MDTMRVRVGYKGRWHHVAVEHELSIPKGATTKHCNVVDLSKPKGQVKSIGIENLLKELNLW